MLRGAIVGLGNVALGVHGPGFRRREDVEIVAVSDLAPERRAAAASVLPRARWYDSTSSLLDEVPLDFIDICTPPSSHTPAVTAALARGVHVLCEKPLVCSREDLGIVTSMAERARRVVHTVHNWHHAPIIRRTTELLAKGAIGALTRIVWTTLRTAPAAVRDTRAANWRLDPAVGGGGILTDHGWHVFYLLQRWMGEAPTTVSARLETRRHVAFAVEDTATVHVLFPSGSAEVFLTWAADVRHNRVELVGTNGRIELDDAVVVLDANGREQRWSCPPPLSQGSVHPDWFDPVLDQFVGEVSGRLPPDGNLAEASLCLEIEALARESSRQDGRWMAMPTR
jgi:predicted dehydrogenase